jgi:hypothetical protein
MATRRPPVPGSFDDADVDAAVASASIARHGGDAEEQKTA